MRKEARHLVGKHNFQSFQATQLKKKEATRTIQKLTVKKAGDYIQIDIQADGFLYNMVRNIVGTLVYVGRNRLKDVKHILSVRDRKKAGITAPACGLCLIKVVY